MVFAGQKFSRGRKSGSRAHAREERETCGWRSVFFLLFFFFWRGTTSWLVSKRTKRKAHFGGSKFSRKTAMWGRDGTKHPSASLGQPGMESMINRCVSVCLEEPEDLDFPFRFTLKPQKVTQEPSFTPSEGLATGF